MKTKSYWLLLLVFFGVLTLSLAGCGGGGGSGSAGGGGFDRDGDGVPDAEDAFPNDPTRFASLTEVPLASLSATTTFSAAAAINNSGEIVGTSDTAGNVRAVAWDAATGAVTELAPLPGELYSAAHDVNDAGMAVGESSKNTGLDFVAVVWPTGAGSAPVELPLLEPATSSAAYSANNAAMIAGEAEQTEASGVVDRAVVWANSASAPRVLTTPFVSTTSSAYFINDSGLVVGEATDAAGAVHAVFWKVDAAGVQAAALDLGTAAELGGLGAVALNVNHAGRVVGEFEDSAGLSHAVQWRIDPGTNTLVAGAANLAPGGVESSASAINDGGGARAAGWRRDRSGPLTITSAQISDFRFTSLSQDIIDPEIVPFSQAFDINDDDMVVGIRLTDSGDQAFLAVP